MPPSLFGRLALFRLRIITPILAVVISLTTLVHAEDGGDNFLLPTPSISLELFWRYRYPEYWDHRAIAVGPLGIFAASYRARSPQAAEQQALLKCQEKLQAQHLPLGRNTNCVLYALGDKIVWSPPISIATELVAVDWRSIQPGPLTGRILVHLPPCGDGPEPEWKQTWFDLLANNGVAITTVTAHKPASRKNSICPSAGWKREHAISNLRHATTQVLHHLRSKFTSSAIYIWADGTSADAIHAMDNTYGAAIITTQASCAMGSTGLSLLPESAIVTALYSTKDNELQRIARIAGMQDMSTYCESVKSKRSNTTAVSFNTRNGFPLWSPQTKDVFANFFGLQVKELVAGTPEALNILPYEAHLEFNRAFRMFEAHRAFVISATGQSFFATGHETPTEALQAALYRCNRSVNGNGFIVARDRCVTFALNDDVVLNDPKRANAILSNSFTQSRPLATAQ